jgi:hypothetical protein
MEARVAEVRKLGIQRLVVPRANAEEASALASGALDIQPISDVSALGELVGG